MGISTIVGEVVQVNRVDVVENRETSIVVADKWAYIERC